MSTQRNSVNKYAGLTKIAFGEGWDQWQAAHPVGSMAAYMTPGVGIGASAMDAARDFSRGHIVAGLGNTLFAAASALPFGGLLKGIAKGSRLAARGIKGVDAASSILHGTPSLERAMSQNYGKMNNANMFAKPFNYIPGMAPTTQIARGTAAIPGAANLAQYAPGLERAGSGFIQAGAPFGGWKGMVAGLGLNTYGDMLHPPAAQPTPYAGLNTIADSYAPSY